MALKGLVGKLSEKLASTLTSKPDRGPWQPSQGGYPRLMALEQDELDGLQGIGGLYVLWHRGVRPQWLAVNHTEDLCAALKAAQIDPDILLYDQNDGVFVTWAECLREQRLGAVQYLHSALEPALAEPVSEPEASNSTETLPIEFPIPTD